MHTASWLKRLSAWLFVAALLGFMSGCATNTGSVQKSSHQTVMSSIPASGPFTPGNKSPYEIFGQVYEVMPDSFGYVEIGVASWYGEKFHGRTTSNGEIYDMYGLSAAHKTLPIPTTVKVTNLDNGKSIVLRINDRGPFHDNRIIDLSYAAAKAIGYDKKGIAPVVVEAVDEVNHPDRYAAANQPVHARYYLQLGAFSEERWANVLKEKVSQLFTDRGQTVQLKILQSEQADKVLHKVWLGPMETPERRADIAALVEAAELGKPINVEVE